MLKVSLDVSDQNIKAKAVRVRNLELNLQKDGVHGYWWKLFNFNVVEKTDGTDDGFTTDHILFKYKK